MTIEELMALGKENGYPPVRLGRSHVLGGSESSWHKYLRYANEFQRKLLANALWRGWSEGPGIVGMVKG